MGSSRCPPILFPWDPRRRVGVGSSNAVTPDCILAWCEASVLLRSAPGDQIVGSALRPGSTALETGQMEHVLTQPQGPNASLADSVDPLIYGFENRVG
jgi:hypothetical protein